MKYALLILIIVLSGCTHKKPHVDVNDISDEGITLTAWQILGPFPSNQWNYLYFDNLERFGFDEEHITADEYFKIPSTDSVKNQLYKSDSYKVDFNTVFGYATDSSGRSSVYAACILKSDQKRTLKLNFSSDNGARIWLNNELIHDYNRGLGLYYYEHYIDLPLREGENFLLIKVINTGREWEMFAAMEKESAKGYQKNQTALFLKLGQCFLKRSAISNDSLYLSDEFPPLEGLFTIHDPNNHILLTDTIPDVSKPYFKSIASLPDGLYTAFLTLRNETFHEKLFVGDIIKTIEKQLIDLKQYTPDTDTGRNIEALAFRYRHLLKPENGRYDFERRNWDKKMIFIYTSLERYSQNLKKGKQPDAGATGGILKSYRSKIDDGIQYYQLFIPKSYSPGKPMALVIEMPKFIKRFDSPLESFRFANIRGFEQFEHLADKYNMFVLDPGCRTIDHVNRNALDEADLWEALEDVKKTYAIDTSRIYLRGACLSAYSAMKLATKYPDKFAALSLTAPETTVSDNNNIWVQQNEPLKYLKNIRNTPVLNIHSAVDPHSPVEASDHLMKEAQHAGLQNFTYHRLPIELQTFYSSEYLDEVFSFYSNYTLNFKPKEISFTTSQLKYNKSFWVTLNHIQPGQNASLNATIANNQLTIQSTNVLSYTIDLSSLPFEAKKPLLITENGKEVYNSMPNTSSITINPPSKPAGVFIKNHDVEGPLVHLFSKPFIVVAGTAGTDEENTRIQTIIDTLNNHWKFRYYTPFRTKPDKNITQADMRNYSLLLIGSPKTNLVFRKLARHLPVQVTDSTVTISNHAINGTALSFYVIAPNPYSSTNYIGIIGSNNVAALTLPGEEEDIGYTFNDISNLGWYDYSIWDSSKDGKLTSGYFDFLWE